MEVARVNILVYVRLARSITVAVLPKEIRIATPTIKRKNGKIQSVGVRPFHSA